MGLYLRNNHYYYRKMLGGKMYYRALKLKRGQEILLSERLKQVEHEVLAAHYGLSYQSVKSCDFREFLQIYKDRKEHKKTLSLDIQRLEKIEKFWDNPELRAISQADIRNLEKHLFSSGLKTTTINRYFELLKSFFNLAIEEGHLKENPLRKYEFFVEDTTRRALNIAELKQILAASNHIQGNPNSHIQAIIYDLIVFALNTGLRLSEILNLRRSYITGDRISYPITQTKYRRRTTSRTQRAKVVYLNTVAGKILGKHKSTDGFVFPLKSRKSYIVRKAITKIRKQSGVQDFTFHQLRHTVSTLVSSRADLATAKIVLGHSDMQTTLKYTHPEKDAQLKAVAELETFFKELLPKD